MANTFIDTARILVRSGAGGNGAVAFHREKYVAAGGPDGGDGGRGGDVILQVDDRMSTLMDFRYKRKYVAENGGNGAGKQCTGKNGSLKQTSSFIHWMKRSMKMTALRFCWRTRFPIKRKRMSS